LFTAIISTERTLVAVAVGGGFVAVGTGDAVGIDVPVPVAANGVGVWVPVGEDVRLGNAVGTKAVEVGNGVNVEKWNKEVGVTCVPSAGKTVGLGGTLEGLRDGSKGIINEQRQQNATRNRAGIRTLTICPCRSYIVTNVERNELICFVMFSIMCFGTRLARFYPFYAWAAAV
jgi:hypothetical protein